MKQGKDTANAYMCKPNIDMHEHAKEAGIQTEIANTNKENRKSYQLPNE